MEAEITAVMDSQRACDGGKQAEPRLSNGPLRAQSKAGKMAEYSATLRLALSAGSMIVLCRAHRYFVSSYQSCELRWHRGMNIRP